MSAASAAGGERADVEAALLLLERLGLTRTTSQGSKPVGLSTVSLPPAPVIVRTDPLTLEPTELALLDLLGPPLLVNTPRAVKRLANSYGRLTALRRKPPHSRFG